MSELSELVQSEEMEEIVAYNSTSFANQWQLIPLDGLSPANADIAHKLNALGQLYYFTKVILRKTRLTDDLHKDMCDNLEGEHLKEVIEIPRDHFKTTIHSESYPMWCALPFLEHDERLMRALGYDTAWIDWMRRCHDQDTRTLTVSENIKNACKIGRKIEFHYKNNLFFKKLFPSIQPDGSCEWSVETMTHKRSGKFDSGQGEGTYDYLGVGGALQSRHYKRVIQDDLVGKEALKSETVMLDTIDYHKLLPGAFDSDPKSPDFDCDEIVVGNRWSYRDLNFHIRKKEPEFRITTHSALGGCCPKHPPGRIIFPQEWTIKKFERWKNRFGAYFFSCQFLNSPTPPGDTKFKASYLNYFTYKTVDAHDKRVMIKHEAKGGMVLKDLMPSALQRSLLVDPNHSGQEGRSRHAILVTGYLPASKQGSARVYILDMYAMNSSHADLVHNIYRLGEKWKIKEPWLETIAAQKWLKYHLEVMDEQRKKDGKWTFKKINEFKSSHAKDAKIQRIEALEPVFERGEVYVLKFGQEQLVQEYLEYPYAETRDILDVLGYSMQVWNPDFMTDRERNEVMMEHNTRARTSVRNKITGY